MNGPKLSIIIPVYNTGRAAVKLVSGLLQDSYANLEIIVVDDGSSDNSLALLRKLQDSRLFVFHQPNHGASSARNFGLTKATGKYISFIDSDDEVSPRFFSSLVRAQQKTSAPLVVTGFRYRRLKQGTVKDAFTNPLPPRSAQESATAYILRLLVADGRLYSSVNKLYLADLIQRHHLRFDERLNFAEDTKFVLDYLRFAIAESSATPDAPLIAFVLRPYYIYNYGTSTSTVATSSLTWRNWQQSYDYLTSWVGPHPSRIERQLLRKIRLRWKVSHALAVGRSNLAFRQRAQYLNPLVLPFAIALAKIRR